MVNELTLILKYKINMKNMFIEHNTNVFDSDNTEMIKQKNVGRNGGKSSAVCRKAEERKQKWKLIN